MTVEQNEIIGRLDGIERHLGRLENALIGDPAVGHKGIVARLETVELLHAEVPSVHEAMREDNKRARTVLQERIDELADNWKRFKYMSFGAAIGAGLAGGGIGAWLVNLLPT